VSKFAELGLVVFHQAGVVARLDAGDGTLYGFSVLMEPPEVIGRIVTPAAMPWSGRHRRLLWCVAMKGVFMMPKGVVFVSNMAKPE